ncbi:MAG: Outer membrane protein [candidate division TM6 bacterium GW2011_GWA2_36_9]|nr:MAG: Outer membrane protein [candidate division TM6 bacterium GW2011_GWA2_36_9]
MDTAYDTRQGVTGTESSCYLYPKDVECDDQCCDINARGRFSITPAFTRLRVTADGAQINNMHLSSFVEFDFFANCNNFYGLTRLRHAYLKVHEKKKSLIVGQTWHPIYPLRCRADTVNPAIGAPIETYARYPQVQLDYGKGDFGLKLAAYSQYQFANTGPDGSTAQYMQNSMTPGLFGAVEIRKKNFFAGAGANMQRLLPALSTTTTTTTVATKTYASDAGLTSFIGTLYCSIKIKDLIFKTKIAAGQNGYQFQTLGGYAVGCLDLETGRRNFR